MKWSPNFIGIMALAVLVGIAGYQWGHYNGQAGKSITLGKEAEAAGGMVKTPTGVAPERYVYYPGYNKEYIHRKVLERLSKIPE